MLLNAGMSFRIWWVFRNSEDAPQWNETVNEFPAFFAPTVRSHLVTFVISLGNLLDTKKGTISFPNLINLAKRDGRVSPHDLEKAEQQLAKMDPTAKKIQILRHNLFAHLKADADGHDVFNKAGITPNQIKNLILDGLILLNLISREIQEVVYADNFDEVECETRNLLKALGNLR